MGVATDFCLLQLKLPVPFSFLLISQEWPFRTEIHSVLAERHFNFVKKDHARDSRVCFTMIVSAVHILWVSWQDVSLPREKITARNYAENIHTSV
jgi:hypothetical protein